jgi:hypothetical protein
LPARTGSAPDFGGEPMIERLLAAIRGMKAPGVLVDRRPARVALGRGAARLAFFLARLGPQLQVVWAPVRTTRSACIGCDWPAR